MPKVLMYETKEKAILNLNQINKNMNINEVDETGTMVKTKSHDYQWANLIVLDGKPPTNTSSKIMAYAFQKPENQWMNNVQFDMEGDWKPEYRKQEAV